jgi:hypothetical protein
MRIPTRYKKTKLSKELSYPIGAELLSEHLSDVPQFSELSICFSDIVSAWKSKFQRILVQGADYEILRLSLWDPFMIYIYPVKRELKRAATEALVSVGLPKLRESMITCYPPNPLRLVHAYIVFSPATLSVHFGERMNGKDYGRRHSGV